MDYPDGFSNEWRDYMTYDKTTDPDAGLKHIRMTYKGKLHEIRDAVFDTEEAFALDFTSKKREGFTSTTDHAMRHEMQRMVDKINELEKRINELEKPIEDYLK